MPGLMRYICVMNKIIAFVNAYTQGVSGGDLRFIELAKRMFPQDTIVVTSRMGRDLCIARGLKARYFITTKETEFRGIIITYIRRVFTVFGLLPKEDVRNAVIYATSDFFPDVIPAFLLRLTGKDVKWVQIIHHLIPNAFLRRGNHFRNVVSFLGQRFSLLLIKKRADRIIAIGPVLADKLKSMGFRGERIAIGYNGINLKEIAGIEAGRDIKGFDAVFIGRLHPSKGIEDLLEVWNLLKGRGKEYSLAIIGKGEPGFVRSLRGKIKLYGLEGTVAMPGYINESLQYLKKAKVFVFPSYEEGWGISICEALACKVPVIAYDLPVYKAIYNDGIVKVGKGDIKKFCHKVLECIEDEDYRAGISGAGSRICQGYDWDNVAEREKRIIGR